MQIKLQLDVNLPDNTITVNSKSEYHLTTVLIKGNIIYDSIRSNPDIVKEAEMLKEDAGKNKYLHVATEPTHNHVYTSKGQVNIVLDIDFDNEIITVSGDSQGIYPLEDEMWMDDRNINNSNMDYNPIILDSIKSQHDPVEKALFKVTEPEYYRILYHEEYATEPDTILQLDMSKFLEQNNL